MVNVLNKILYSKSYRVQGRLEAAMGKVPKREFGLEGLLYILPSCAYS